MKREGIFFWMILISLIFITNLSALTIDSVSTNPDSIGPGEISRIKLGLENNGDKTIEEVSILLDLSEVPFAPSDSSSEVGFDEIKKERIKFADFEVVALNDAKPGIYKIPVQVTYLEDETSKSKNFLISLIISSEPLITLNAEEGLFLKNSENEVSIKVVNKGLSDAKFLEIEIMPDTRYMINPPEKMYLGDLDSDDFDSATFNLFFKENSLSNIDLLVQITYKDSLNKNYLENFQVPIKVYSREKAIELGFIEKNNVVNYIVLVVVLIILYIIYRRFKKRRKAKKSKEEKEVY